MHAEQNRSDSDASPSPRRTGRDDLEGVFAGVTARSQAKAAFMRGIFRQFYPLRLQAGAMATPVALEDPGLSDLCAAEYPETRTAL